MTKGYPHCELCKGEGIIGYDNRPSMLSQLRFKDADAFINGVKIGKVKEFVATKKVPRICPRCFGPDGKLRLSGRFMPL